METLKQNIDGAEYEVDFFDGDGRPYIAVKRKGVDISFFNVDQNYFEEYYVDCDTYNLNFEVSMTEEEYEREYNNGVELLKNFIDANALSMAVEVVE